MINYGAVAHAVFSNPEVAAVGLTGEQVEQSGLACVVITQDWASGVRALSTKLTYPRTKLIVDASSYEILGCHLIGPKASTMIHQVMMLMSLKTMFVSYTR